VEKNERADQGVYLRNYEGVGLSWWYLGSTFLVSVLSSSTCIPTNIRMTTLHNLHYTRPKRYTVSQIRTSDLPTLERERVIRILGKANRSLGYQVGCADHCTTTACFWVEGTQVFLRYEGWDRQKWWREGAWIGVRAMELR
jgi:hypothetical protein